MASRQEIQTYYDQSNHEVGVVMADRRLPGYLLPCLTAIPDKLIFDHPAKETEKSTSNPIMKRAFLHAKDE